jgi:hypothetical protein
MNMVHLTKCQIIKVNLTKGQIKMVNLTKGQIRMVNLIKLFIRYGQFDGRLSILIRFWADTWSNKSL